MPPTPLPPSQPRAGSRRASEKETASFPSARQAYDYWLASSPGTATAPNSGLTRRDVAVLLLLCLLLYGYHLVHRRVLSTHEAVHCENVREMFQSHDWIIPTYGDRPWLERPPLPHWVTGSVASLVGGLEEEWALRLGSILAGVLAVVLLARLSALWYGRSIGLLSGAILATMHEFSDYATGPEADIFLCALVTAAHALLVRLEFGQRRADKPRLAFLGKRSWALLAFFVVLGLTNLAKGPFFGMLFVLVPLAGYLLWNRDWHGLRRYTWLWGWLACAAVASAWYAVALWRYPDMIDLWMGHYTSRLDTGYLGEPFWYYFVTQPWNSFPWAIPALIGLVLTARRAFRERGRPERYLWCWACLPLFLLSFPSGKHHHYLLHCLPPVAVFAALGAVRLWRWLGEQAAWLRQPWLGTLLLGAAGDAVLALFRARIPGPDWILPALLAGWPVLVFLLWYGAGRRNGRVAAAIVFAALVAGESLLYAQQTEFLNAYADDEVFLRRAAERTPADVPVLVINDDHPLNASWFLFYLHGRGRLLHNVTFLREDNLTEPDVFLITRTSIGPALAEYGTAELLVQSRHTRGEDSPADRWALYHVRFHPGLKRVPAARISPAEAAILVKGPYLKP